MTVRAGRPAQTPVELPIDQGCDNTFQFLYYDTIGGVVTPVDLTGWSARSQIRRSVGGDLWHEFTGITLGDDGAITLELAASVTEDVEWNQRNMGVWDMELTNPDGKVIPFAGGPVVVNHDVTRPTSE